MIRARRLSLLFLLFSVGLAPLPTRGGEEPGSIAGSGTVALSTGVMDVTGRYEIDVGGDLLHLDLEFDGKGRLVGSAAFLGEEYPVRGGRTKVARKSGLQSVKIPIRKLGTLKAAVSGGRLIGTAKISKGSPVEFSVPLAHGETDIVSVTWNFAQDDRGKVTGGGSIAYFDGGSQPLAVRRGKVKKAGRSSSILLVGTAGRGTKKAKLLLKGPVGDGAIDATWKVTAPCGLQNALVEQRLPPHPAPPPLPAEPSIVGRVLDADGAPLEAAVVTLLESGGSAWTDGAGEFALPVSGTVGRQKILIEKAGYTWTHRHVEVEAGIDVRIPPVHLVALDAGTWIGPEGRTHAGGGYEVEVPAGALDRDALVRGARPLRESGIPFLPETTDFTYCLFVAPTREASVTVRIANDLSFPPGTRIPVGVYSKSSDQWEAAGTAEVTPDGTWVEAEVDRLCWIAMSLPLVPPPDAGAPTAEEIVDVGDPETCRPAGVDSYYSGVGSRVGVADGDLVVEHSLPTYRSLNRERTVRLVYHSRLASPTVLLARDYDLVPPDGKGRGTLVPDQHGFEVAVAGRIETGRYRADELPGRFAYLWDGRRWDGSRLATGFHRYSLSLTNYYAATYRLASRFGDPGEADTGVRAPYLKGETSTHRGHAFLRNESGSPYGAGWGVAGIQRILERPDGVAVVLDGDGSRTTFSARGITTAAGGGGSPVSDGASAVACSFSSVGPVAVGENGKLYFAAFVRPTFQVYEVDSDGKVRVFAGKGGAGLPVEGVPATETGLDAPVGLAVKDTGEVYIAEAGNHVVRRVALDGIVTTVAGTGHQGTAGDGGPATAAQLTEPTGIAIGPDGSLFIADPGVGTVRKVDPQGTISTFAGSSRSGFSGDGGPATVAELSSPSGVAVDGDGRVYIADTANHRIRRVAIDGTISTIAGTGQSAFSGDGGPAANASLSFPRDVTLGPDGALYVADYGNLRVRRIDGEGTITTVAGVGGSGYNGDGGAAIWARLVPFAVAVAPDGGVLIGDAGSSRVRRVEPEGEYSDGPDFTRLVRAGAGHRRHYPDGTELDFDAAGTMTAIRDRFGNEATYEWEDLGDVKAIARIVDPVGKITEFAYDSNGKLESIRDPGGRITEFVVDGLGDLREIHNPPHGVKEPLGTSVRHFTYDDEHRLVEERDPGLVTAYSYDAFGSVARIAKGDDTLVRTFGATVAEGTVNALGAGGGTADLPAAKVDPASLQSSATVGGAPASLTRTNRWGASLDVKDPLGRWTRFERDGRNEVTRVDLPTGRTVRYEYSVRGNVTHTFEEAIGAETFLEYHPTWNLVTRTRDALNAETIREYDENGNLTELTDARGKETRFAFDSRGLLETVEDALGHETHQRYDEDGNLSEVEDAKGNVTKYETNDHGHVVKVTDAEGNPTIFRRGALNLTWEVEDALGHVTRFDFDIVKGTMDPDAAERIAQVTAVADAVADQVGSVTTFAYDDIGRLRSRTDPRGNAQEFEYDEEGRLTRRTDGKKQTATVTYRPDGSVGRIDYADADGHVRDTVLYEYDEHGRPTGVRDDASELGFGYDAADRLMKATTGNVGGYPATATEYTYDRMDRRTSMKDIEGGQTTYKHDSLGRITEIRNPRSRVSTFGYDAVGRRTVQYRDQGGLHSKFEYDEVGNLLEIEHTDQTVDLLKLTYTYDDVGNRRSMEDHLGLHSYGFDDTYRLEAASHAGAFPDEVYAYDGVGNRVSAAHEYDDDHSLIGDPEYEYEYDDNGSLTRKWRRSDSGLVAEYTWDTRNRLVKVVHPGGGPTVEFAYDALDRRIEKRVDGAVTRYVHDGQDLLYELDGAGEVIARYTYGGGIDELLFMERWNGAGYDYYEYLTDALGTVRVILDHSESPVRSYDYDSFGRLVAESGTLENPFRFTGREWDAETGLYYFRARYYDPGAGRFISQDPLGFRGGDVNLYAYVGNRPTAARDPMGQFIVLTPDQYADLLEGLVQLQRWCDRNGVDPGLVIGYGMVFWNVWIGRYDEAVLGVLGEANSQIWTPIILNLENQLHEYLKDALNDYRWDRLGRRARAMNPVRRPRHNGPGAVSTYGSWQGPGQDGLERWGFDGGRGAWE